MRGKENNGEYRYFSSVEGHIVPRYGAMGQYIGAKLVPSGEKSEYRSLLGPSGLGSFSWDWDTDKVIRIALNDCVKYGREYSRALASGSIIERKERDYDNYMKSLSATADTPAVEEKEQSRNKESKS